MGGLTGATFAGFFMYYQALSDVKSWLDPKSTQDEYSVGEIISGPIAIWPGMHLTREDVTELLYAAGFAKTTSPTTPGDFNVSDNQIVLIPFTENESTIPDKSIIKFQNNTIYSLSSNLFFDTLTLPLFALAKFSNSNDKTSQRSSPKHLIC